MTIATVQAKGVEYHIDGSTIPKRKWVVNMIARNLDTHISDMKCLHAEACMRGVAEVIRNILMGNEPSRLVLMLHLEHLRVHRKHDLNEESTWDDFWDAMAWSTVSHLYHLSLTTTSFSEEEEEEAAVATFKESVPICLSAITIFEEARRKPDQYGWNQKGKKLGRGGYQSVPEGSQSRVAEFAEGLERELKSI